MATFVVLRHPVTILVTDLTLAWLEQANQHHKLRIYLKLVPTSGEHAQICAHVENKFLIDIDKNYLKL